MVQSFNSFNSFNSHVPRANCSRVGTPPAGLPRNGFVPFARPVFLNRNGGASFVRVLCPRRRVHVDNRNGGGVSFVDVSACRVPCPVARCSASRPRVRIRGAFRIHKGQQERRKQERRRVARIRGAWRSRDEYGVTAAAFRSVRGALPTTGTRGVVTHNRDNAQRRNDNDNQQQRYFRGVISRPRTCPVSLHQRRRKRSNYGVFRGVAWRSQ